MGEVGLRIYGISVDKRSRSCCSLRGLEGVMIYSMSATSVHPAAVRKPATSSAGFWGMISSTSPAE